MNGFPRPGDTVTWHKAMYEVVHVGCTSGPDYNCPHGNRALTVRRIGARFSNLTECVSADKVSET